MSNEEEKDLILPWSERVSMLSINPDVASRDDVARLAADLMETRQAYNELIYAVGMKWPNETRHQTALRYIKSAEDHSGVGCVVKTDTPSQK